MALIDEYVRLIRNAVYGKEVRSAIANGIEQCYRDVSEAVERADTAAENADQKASLANEKASAASSAASSANSAASSANSAASEARSIANKLDALSASATKLEAGAAPTVSVSDADGHKHMAFGIPKGDKGDAGKDFHIARTFSSISAMNAYTSAELYDYAMIDTGSVQDADTGKLYCWEADRTWHYIGDLSGAQGIKGETGTGIASIELNSDYTLTIHYTDGTSVTTSSIRGATGPTGATGNGISNIELDENGCLSITMDDGTAYTTSSVVGPQGEQGPVGDTGAGITSVQMNGDYTLTINLDNGVSYTTPFSIRGATGEQGIQGEIGPQGIGITGITMNSDYTLTITLSDGTSYNTESIRGETGPVGNGVDHISLNADYSLTIYFTDGTSSTTSPIRGEKGEKGDTGTGIKSIQLNSDYTLTFTYTDDTTVTTSSIRGEIGETGNGIDRVVMNDDYTLTIIMTNGDTYKTESIRGATGETGPKGDTGETGPKGETGAVPSFRIGSVTTLEPDQEATASISGTAEQPLLNLGIPQGRTGSVEDIYAEAIPISESDSTTIKEALDSKLEHVPEMTGATASDNGEAGLVPAPVAGDESKFLAGNGTWKAALTEHQDISGKLDASQKGAAGGLAELDASGKVPSSQLPSYVDDVVEYSSRSEFPAEGESGKIYIDTEANISYRWSGTVYVEISQSLGLGETSSTAYRGDRGKAAYDHAAAKGNEFSTGLYKIATNGEGHVTEATPVAKSDITSLGIPSNEDLIGKSNVVDWIYPVGSIYMSVNSASPESLFGGTWEQLKDRFLLGVGDTYKTAGATGGAASQSYTPAGSVGNHTLTTSEIPSHNHTFTGSAVNTGNQSQDHTHTGTSGNQSANHTHTGTSGNPSANHHHSGPEHTHTGPSHTHTGPSHSHSLANHGLYGWASNGSQGGLASGANVTTSDSQGWSTGSAGTGATGSAGTGATGKAGTGNTGTVSAWHTHTTTTGNQSASHTHTTTTGGVSKNHTHSVTAAGSIGNTGGGGAHNHGFTGTAATISTMPPYLAVYMWKRTA